MKQKTKQLIETLKAAVPGTTFKVSTKSEREAVLNIARTLREAGTIKVRIHTSSDKKGFTVVAF